ncbi:MAG TPA: type II secretion system F family protein [Candidatus Nitrosotenuis sp.]|nr:type II secretion system F family protein [Candidatus Nitrosotenuis sp.]
MRKIRLKDKIELCFHWRYYVQCQLPLVEVFAFLRQTHPNRNLQEILAQIEQALIEGHKLSTALKLFPKVFDSITIQLIYVAEQVGDYSTYLAYVEDYLEWRGQMTHLLYDALRYPAILCGLMILLFSLIDTLLLPQLLLLFQSLGVVSYPWSTILMLQLMAWLPWALLSLSALVIGLWLIDRRKIPYVGQWIQKAYLMLFTQQLGILLKARVDLISALAASAQVIPDPQFYCRVHQRLLEGYSLSKAIAEEFPVHSPLHRMIELGERTGKLGEILVNYSQMELHLLKQRVVTWVMLIQPILVIFMGMMLGGVILGVVYPIYQVVSKNA